MTKAMERWRYQDPAKVYERIQAQEHRRKARAKQSRSQKAREALESLFEGEPDGDVQSR